MKSPNALYAGALILVVLAIIALNQPAPAQAYEPKQFASKAELDQFLQRASFSSVPMHALETTSAPVAASSADASSKDFSATNVQVAGVDEADITKTDGTYIYTMTDDSVVIARAFPPERAGIVSTIRANGAREFFIFNGKLILFGQWYDYQAYDVPEPHAAGAQARIADYPYRYSEKTYARVYDLADKEMPLLASNITLDGNYVSSRMIGSSVYALVTVPAYRDMPIPVFAPDQKEFPDIQYFDVADDSYAYTNVITLDADTGAFANKVYLLGWSSTVYASREAMYIAQPERRDIRIMERMVDDVLVPLLPLDKAAQVKAIRTSNMSQYDQQRAIGDALGGWLRGLSDEDKARFEQKLQEGMARLYEDLSKEREMTVVHKITLNSGNITYAAHGEVPGRVLNQFSMDEHNGYLRIATTTQPSYRFGGPMPMAGAGGSMGVQVSAQSATEGTVAKTSTGQASIPAQPSVVKPQPEQEKNHVYVLDASLKIAGKLEDLAPGERIYAARFINDRAYLVTFRKVDPLFVIDLKEPQKPRILGTLKIPGYSDYLHPYDETHLIGIGKEAQAAEEGNFAWYQGVKVALFDVSDVEKPKEVATYAIGDRGTDSYALHDHKAFLFDKARNVLVIPVLLAKVDEKQYPQGVPPFAYGNYVWQGAYVLNVSEQGIALRGTVSHGGEDALRKSGFYYSPEYDVKRSLYIENVLYTVSDTAIKMNDLATLKDLGEIALPHQSPEPMPVGIEGK